MKIVKYILVIGIVSALVFNGVIKMNHKKYMYIGNDLKQTYCSENIRLIDNRNTLVLVEDEVSYCYLISEDGIQITSSVRFNSEGEIIDVMGIEVLEITKDMIKTPNNIKDMLEIYGKPHVDIGYGFYIPCYILSDASVLAFHTTDEKVTDMSVYSYFN